MDKRTLAFGNTRVEVCTHGKIFLGVGAIWIGQTKVRSGRLMLRPYTQSFAGHELAELRLLGVDIKRSTARLKIEATFRPLLVKMLRDHSFDPIHETADWDPLKPATSGAGRLDIVLRKSSDTFNGVKFHGFDYHYEYAGKDVPLFYILDQASWELDGQIAGATAISQSACSAPTATFAKDTAWTTEGVIHFPDTNSRANPVMTHNLPRWASHAAFDFQYKGSKTLIGVFDRVELIRSVLKREPGKPELKTFDKHIFDQANKFATSPKKILVNTDRKTQTDQKNVWSWIFEETNDRARAEFGLKAEPMLPRLAVNYWVNFTVDTYYKDLLPAAAGLGIKQVFVDNLNKSDMTEAPGLGGNMCGGQQYEIADKIGGKTRVKAFIDACAKHDIQVMSWTNNDQSYSSPLNHPQHKMKTSGWYVRMEDTRLKYGGAYTNSFSILDFGMKEPREYWVNCLKKNKREVGLCGYLFDSFYNLGFMPVNFQGGSPRTMWRGTLQGFKELQDAGVHFLIESFGPFGQPQHGCPSSYNVENIFACYRVGLGNDYTTVPGAHAVLDTTPRSSDALYYCLAHMANPNLPLFVGDKRIDEAWGAEHRRALRDYHENMKHMRRRYLQEGGQGVLWHDEKRRRATLFNFAARTVKLPAGVRVTNVSTGTAMPTEEKYTLAAWQTYAIVGDKLPVKIG